MPLWPLPDKLAVRGTCWQCGSGLERALTDLMRAVIAAQPATVSALVFASEKTGRAFNGWGKSVTAATRLQFRGKRLKMHSAQR